MKTLQRMFSGARSPRGLSRTATLIIAVVLVLLGWRVVMFLLEAITGLLRVAVEIGVLIIAVLIVAWLIKTLAKKIE